MFAIFDLNEFMWLDTILHPIQGKNKDAITQAEDPKRNGDMRACCLVL